MQLNEFISQSDDWAASLGYTLLNRSADGSWRSYCSMSRRCALVTVLDHNGEAAATVEGMSNWQFVRVVTGKLQFKHPRIDDFLDAVDDLLIASTEAQQRIHHRKVLAAYQGATNG